MALRHDNNIKCNFISLVITLKMFVKFQRQKISQ